MKKGLKLSLLVIVYAHLPHYTAQGFGLGNKKTCDDYNSICHIKIKWVYIDILIPCGIKRLVFAYLSLK